MYQNAAGVLDLNTDEFFETTLTSWHKSWEFVKGNVSIIFVLNKLE